MCLSFDTPPFLLPAGGKRVLSFGKITVLIYNN